MVSLDEVHLLFNIGQRLAERRARGGHMLKGRRGRRSLLQAMESSGGSLTVALYMYSMERGEIEVGFAIASILMILTLVINLSAKFLGAKLKKN